MKFKKFLALGLSLALGFSTMVYAAPATGDALLLAPTIEAAVPTEVAFAIDPFELGEAGQIVSADLPIINLSNVAIKADAAVTFTGADVTLDAAANINQTDPSDTDKTAYLAVIAATAAAAADEESTELSADATYVAEEDLATSDSLVNVDPTSKAVTASFALAKATGTTITDLTSANYGEFTIDGLAADDAGVGAFKFYGKVNTYGAWEANALSASIVYTFTGLVPATYDEIVADGLATDGQGFMKSAALTPLGFAVTTLTVPRSGPDKTVNFNFGGNTITGVKVTDWTGYAIPATAYVANTSANTLTFKTGTGAAGIFEANYGPVDFVVTLSNGESYTLALNSTN